MREGERNTPVPSGGTTLKSYTTPTFHANLNSYNRPKVNRFTKLFARSIVIQNIGVKHSCFCCMARDGHASVLIGCNQRTRRGLRREAAISHEPANASLPAAANP